LRIADVRAYPLTAAIAADIQVTSAGPYPQVSALVVEVCTDDGRSGWGEGLVRFGPQGGAELVRHVLRPKLIGADPFEVERLWPVMARSISGRMGGTFIETLSAIDIALWDLMGQEAAQPVHRLLGSCGRTHVAAYASSVTWGPLEVAKAQLERAIALGFPLVKVKLGAPVEAALARARALAEVANGRTRLCADANWVFDVADALRLARGLADLDYHWLEEPIVPEDLDGYRRLAQLSPIRLAAGESEFTASGARDLIASRALGVIQPDVARSGGITETRRIASLAHAFHTAYAPHVGFSGAICVAASLHLAAAMPNFLTFECMFFANPLRDALTRTPVGAAEALTPEGLPVPQGPGLGIEIDRAALASLEARA
jgi:D-galactarolactone cycloisomerase